MQHGTNMRKWGARTIVALGGIATMYFTTGGWDTEESIALVTAIVGAATSFLVPPD
jgi:hypothetical protein